VFDSVAVYETASPEQAADFLYALADFVKGRLATAYFNYESPELLGVSQISQELKGSHLVDNIILLSYVEISTRLRRAIAVPKVRGSNNIQTTREYVIGAGGISLLDESVAEGQEATPWPSGPCPSVGSLWVELEFAGWISTSLSFAAFESLNS
jgi:circadian clock protein KaiC